MPWWILPPVIGLPWLVAIAFYWPRVRRDGHVPPSLAEVVKDRLWTRP